MRLTRNAVCRRKQPTSQCSHPNPQPLPSPACVTFINSQGFFKSCSRGRFGTSTSPWTPSSCTPCWRRGDLIRGSQFQLTPRPGEGVRRRLPAIVLRKCVLIRATKASHPKTTWGVYRVYPRRSSLNSIKAADPCTSPPHSSAGTSHFSWRFEWF